MINRILKITVLTLISISVTGCAILGGSQPVPVPPPVQIVTQQIPQEIYQPPLPSPVKLEDVRWFVITADNLEDQISRVERIQDGDFVIFAVTPRDYENMAGNLQELRRYVRQQREIIEYYREATRVPESKSEWQERNNRLADEIRGNQE